MSVNIASKGKVGGVWAVLGVLILGGAAIVGVQKYAEHVANQHDQAVAQRDARCGLEVTNPHKPFDKDLSCVGWRPRSDIPLPPQG